MKRKGISAAFAGAVAATTAVYLLCRAYPPEALYAGQPVSVWIRVLDSPQLFEAAGNVGTNLEPLLLTAVEMRDNPIRRTYRRLWPGMPGWMKTRWPRPVDPAMVRSNACFLLPYLRDSRAFMQLLKNNRDPLVRATAASALRDDADRTVTLALVAALQDDNSLVCQTAGFVLASTNREDGLVVPACMKRIHDQNPWARFSAATAIGFRPAGRQAAIAAFEELQNSTNETIRAWAGLSMEALSPDGTSSAGNAKSK